ncbi:hypothetical protein [Stenotrophomonas phage CM2]
MDSTGAAWAAVCAAAACCLFPRLLPALGRGSCGCLRGRCGLGLLVPARVVRGSWPASALAGARLAGTHHRPGASRRIRHRGLSSWANGMMPLISFALVLDGHAIGLVDRRDVLDQDRHRLVHHLLEGLEAFHVQRVRIEPRAALPMLTKTFAATAADVEEQLAACVRLADDVPHDRQVGASAIVGGLDVVLLADDRRVPLRRDGN